MSIDDRKFMSAAFGCAAAGRGSVEPNPMVGAVIVRDGVEIARGWHRRFGGPHAEIDALAACPDARGATLYVTLEPCCHHGKTPPCTDAIIEAGIARVVVAMTDPDEKVAGRGVEILRRAGIEVTVGVMEAEAKELLAAYIKHRTTGCPWVICKWAQTRDGYLALPAGQGQWISSEASRARVHELRSWCDGILVGIETVLADDPLLNNRSGQGKQPVRVVLDSRLRISGDCQLVRTAGQVPLIVVTTLEATAAKPQAVREFEAAGVEILPLPGCASGVDLGALLDALGQRGWTYLLVEGGAAVLQSFVTGGLADEVLVFISPQTVGSDHPELPRLAYEDLTGWMTFMGEQTEGADGDRMLRFVRSA